MQTRNRGSGRTASREPTRPKATRAQKKAHENFKVLDTKVTNMITSSSRKPRVRGAHKKIDEPVASTLTAKYDLLLNETSGTSLGHDAGCEEGNTDCVTGTIFSPAFHLKHVGGESANGVDFVKYFQNEDHTFHQEMEVNYSTVAEHHGFVGQETSESTVRDENYFVEATNISSEVSTIYLAMKNSKLECLDEHGREPMSTDLYVDEDDNEEFDDFDPYLFIKNLPALSSVAPTFRPLLLPKQTRSCPPTSLVLDLDETLVHSTLDPCDDADFTFTVNFNLQEHTVYVRCRPHLRDFLVRGSLFFEIIIFTASLSIYAEQLLNVLDPRRKIFRHRVFRDSCIYVEGNYLKDLSVLGRDLSRVIIVDNSPQAFGFQVDNGIPIESWFDDRLDTELLSLLPFLESLAGVDDVRPLIANKFNLREKIATADFSLNSNRGDSLMQM